MGGHERDWNTIPPLMHVRVEGGKREENDGILGEKVGWGGESH